MIEMKELKIMTEWIFLSLDIAKPGYNNSNIIPCYIDATVFTNANSFFYVYCLR